MRIEENPAEARDAESIRSVPDWRVIPNVTAEIELLCVGMMRSSTDQL